MRPVQHTPKQALRRYFKLFVPSMAAYVLFIILTLTLTWGILEMFILELPRLPVFWVFPIFMLAQGLASWRLSKKYGTGFCLP